LEIALGIDEGIKIEKKLKNKFSESKGLLGGKKQITYEYEIEVTNNRKTSESITILDQLPRTMNDKIEIEMIMPKEDEKILKENRELLWQIKLNPGEKKIIPLKFLVIFPDDINVYGLE
jgi:uncharacterized protein (TIGR02231 family)